MYSDLHPFTPAYFYSRMIAEKTENGAILFHYFFLFVFGLER